jgi:DNA-binding GntR family transcriptional regulator
MTMSASDDVYDRLRQALISREIEEGQPLTENGLASRFGVSRTPVREALRRLEHDGLVHRDGRGFLVRPRSPEEIIQIYEARALLEGATARAAADRRTLTDLSRLAGLVAEEQGMAKAPLPARTAMNQRFHEAVWSASHQFAYQDILGRLAVLLLRYPATTLGHRNRWKEAVAQHVELVEAISRQDGDVAEAVARRHIEDARDVRLAMWREDPASMGA